MFMHFPHNFNDVITPYAQVNEYQLNVAVDCWCYLLHT
jgi:hypothetical protein